MFGCTVYAHVKDGKLDARAIKCVFLGYPEGIKGYKLWCIKPNIQKVVISIDVVFKEDDFPYKTKTLESDSSSRNH